MPGEAAVLLLLILLGPAVGSFLAVLLDQKVRGEGFIRINLACPRSVVTEALDRIERMLRAND